MNNSDLFDRKDCKASALSQLKGKWKIPCLVSLFYFILVGLLNMGNIIDSIKNSTVDYSRNGNSFYFDMSSTPIQLGASDYIGMGISLLSIVVSGIFAIAFAKFFLDLSNGINPTFDGFFKSLELWAKGVLEILWSSLFIFLWSLLFVVPGIIKSIAYSQAFFILAEYPDVSVTQALKISQKITKGYKADLFVLELSFVGWALLSLATAGIGFIWLLPYIQTAQANAYKFLMKNAIEKNRVSYEELHKGARSDTASSSTTSSNSTIESSAQNFWGDTSEAINNEDVKNDSDENGSTDQEETNEKQQEI